MWKFFLFILFLGFGVGCATHKAKTTDSSLHSKSYAHKEGKKRQPQAASDCPDLTGTYIAPPIFFPGKSVKKAQHEEKEIVTISQTEEGYVTNYKADNGETVLLFSAAGGAFRVEENKEMTDQNTDAKSYSRAIHYCKDQEVVIMELEFDEKMQLQWALYSTIKRLRSGIEVKSTSLSNGVSAAETDLYIQK